MGEETCILSLAKDPKHRRDQKSKPKKQDFEGEGEDIEAQRQGKFPKFSRKTKLKILRERVITLVVLGKGKKIPGETTKI